MKVILLALQTIDGYIATYGNTNQYWGTDDDNKIFRDKTREIGTVIMGSNTYKNFTPLFFKKRYGIVLTSRPEEYSIANNVEFLNLNPTEVIKYLEKKSISEVAVVGGGRVYNEFIEAGLIDEMFITISIGNSFGTGITLWPKTKLVHNMKMVKTFIVNDKELMIQLERISY